MVTLGMLHYIYIIMVVFIIVALMFKKEIVLPCIIGIFLIGLAYSHDVVKSIQILYNSIVSAATEFLGIIVVIALVVAMSKALGNLGSDELIIRPLKNVVRTKKVAFFVIGCVMLIVSWFIWPSPAVALVGALLLPVALKTGLPAIWAAVAMNIFGHGVGLSSDFFIQGAPSITAKAAGVSVVEMMTASVPIWAVMSIVTIAVSFFMFLQDMKKNPVTQPAEIELEEKHQPKPTIFAYFMAILTPAAFILDVVLMIQLKIVGGDATALVGGTALLVMVVIMMFNGDFWGSLERITDHIKDGFKFAIKIFAPVIVIAAFFFMGSGDIAQQVLGKGAPSILNDLGLAMSHSVPMSKAPIAIIEMLIGVVTGLDGSGFSGLPLVGSIAKTFSVATGVHVASLAALGQIVTVWVGGGTIIPWGVIPVAAICNVKATDLARKNLIPVLCGLAAATVFTMFLI